jgi:hypothetical protein
MSLHHSNEEQQNAMREETPGEFELLEIAIRELSVAAQLFSAADHRQWLEWLDGATPALGSALVARAWSDTAFKRRALLDGTLAGRGTWYRNVRRHQAYCLGEHSFRSQSRRLHFVFVLSPPCSGLATGLV